MVCFYDSVPAIFVTGQVSTFRMTNELGVRQIGFQETPIVKMCKEITKYAIQILEPDLVEQEFEKAYKIAVTDRPGPVLIDIPDNVQRMEIEKKKNPSF